MEKKSAEVGKVEEREAKKKTLKKGKKKQKHNEGGCGGDSSEFRGQQEGSSLLLRKYKLNERITGNA